MNWKRHLTDELKNYNAKVKSLDNIRERIIDLDLRLSTVKTSNADGMPSGSGGHYEDAMISAISEKNNLWRSYNIVEQDLKQINKGLSCLDETELTIIESLYFGKTSPEQLAQKLCMSVSSIYEHRNKALRKIAIFLYGTEQD